MHVVPQYPIRTPQYANLIPRAPQSTVLYLKFLFHRSAAYKQTPYWHHVMYTQCCRPQQKAETVEIVSTIRVVGPPSPPLIWTTFWAPPLPIRKSRPPSVLTPCPLSQAENFLLLGSAVDIKLLTLTQIARDRGRHSPCVPNGIVL